jgi:epoxyqueuosine reductase
MDLMQKLQCIKEEQHADFFGVADLTPARAAILAQGGPVIASFPRAISVGIALLSSIVDQLPQRSQRAVSMTYRHHAYDVVNARLDNITSQMSSLLVTHGHRALPVPASQIVDDEHLHAIFSNKMAAHLAGLGWIGKSCLLVTPEVGPRVRWATVLTDAPLEAAGTPMADACGDCTECVDICPPHAFTGRSFDYDEPREARFAAHECKRYMDSLSDDRSTRICGMCLYVCPYGRTQSVLLG